MIVAFIYALISGVAVGCLTGLVEVTALFLREGKSVWSFLVPAMIFYSVACSLMALAVGILRWVISRVRCKETPPAEAWIRLYLAVLIPLFLFIVLGGHVNINWLPSFTDPRSIAFDIFFLALNLGLGIWLYRQPIPKWFLPALLIIGVGAGISISVFALSQTQDQMTRPALPASSPNILLITLDALRADHLSVYGYPRRTSPTLEEFAKEGIVFERAFANSSWTKASVGTMFTSLYPSSHGANEMTAALSGTFTTLPEILQSKGYVTGIFSANSFVSPVFGFGQGVDYFYYKNVSIFKVSIIGHILFKLSKFSPAFRPFYEAFKNEGGSQKITKAPFIKQNFLNWVETLKGKPFFAYVHFIEPHSPYEPPAPFNKLYDPDFPPPYMSREPYNQGMEPFHKAEKLSGEKFNNLVAQYDGNITFVDSVLGELFQNLKDEGLYDRTLIIVTSDHGEEFYDHGGWGHGQSLYNVLLHVPLLMRYPPLFSAGVRTPIVSRHVDLLPTILDFSAIPAPDSIEGKSLIPQIKNPGSGTDPRPVYSEVLHGKDYARALQRDNDKVMEVHDRSKEAQLFFDLAQDPGEKNPLKREEHPKGAELKKLLSFFQQKAQEKAMKGQSVEIDKETKERLKALGYLQ